jgi:uncharacterized Fe-S center protein
MSEENKTEKQGISRDGITRRDFLKNAAAGAAGVAAFAALGGCVAAAGRQDSATSSTGSLVGAATQDTTPVSNPKVVYPIPNTRKAGGSKVYFTKEITAASLVKAFQALNVGPASGDKVAVKISTGEPPHSNYLRPELIGALVQSLKADIVEDNTAYPGQRSNTTSHYKVIQDHGFENIAHCVIMEEKGTVDLPTAANVKRLPYDRVGAELNDYQFFVNLAHFKGHAMAGFGGVLKNQSIGVASVEGKQRIHRGGADAGNIFNAVDAFREAMAEAAQAVHNHFGQGKIVYINVMNNLSVDCDCDGNPATPQMGDIGIAASTDPVALDKACLDFVYGTNSSIATFTGTNAPLMQRIERQNGYLTVVHAEEIGLGSQNYEIVNI